MNDSSNNQSSATSALRATARTPGSLLDLTTAYSRETKHGLRRRRANKITVVTVPDPHDRLTRSSGNGYGGGRLTKTRTHRPVRRAAWTFIASARQHVAKRFCGRRAVIIYANGSARFLNTTLSRFTRRPTDGVKREKSPRGDLRRIKKKKTKRTGGSCRSSGEGLAPPAAGRRRVLENSPRLAVKETRFGRRSRATPRPSPPCAATSCSRSRGIVPDTGRPDAVPSERFRVNVGTTVCRSKNAFRNRRITRITSITTTRTFGAAEFGARHARTVQTCIRVVLFSLCNHKVIDKAVIVFRRFVAIRSLFYCPLVLPRRF